MGRIRLHLGKEQALLSLANSTVVGRHWSCDVQVPHPSVPLRWLEIRWSLEGWLWRALSGGERTRGMGAVHQEGWRLLSLTGHRVRLDGAPLDILVDLEDADPPTAFAQHLISGIRIEGDAFERWFQRGNDGCIRMISGDTDGPAKKDGSVVLLQGEPYRLFIPAVNQPTSPVRLDLADPNIWVGISGSQEEAVFSNGSVQVSVRGACVKVLATYARAVIEGNPWLRTADAHSAWVQRGGLAKSSPDRLAWERSKLRKKLAEQGVIQLDALFESRRKLDFTETRLSLEQEQLSID